MSMKTLLASLCVASSLCMLSCVTTTRNNLFVKADETVQARNYAAAAAELDGPDSPKYYRDKDQVLRYLDTAMLYHVAGNPQESVKRFDEAERLIEDNYTKSVSGAVKSFIINDYQLEYFGEPYEDVYLNVFKAIDYIRMNKFDDSFVEIRRVDEKLNLLEDKYGKLASSMNGSSDSKGRVKAGTTKFHNSALAQYLGLLLYRADGRASDAVINRDKIKQAFASQPSLFDFPCPQLDALLQPTEQARIDVIGFSGRSPEKRASTLRILTEKDLLVIEAEREDEKGNMVPTALAPIPFPAGGEYRFKAMLPEMYKRPSQVAKIVVFVDGFAVGQLSLIEKMDTIALETFELHKTPLYFKTVIRAVTKGIVTAKVKEKANEEASKQGGLLSILSFAGGVAADVVVDNSEQADLRCDRYFPGQARVGEFLVDPGEHDVSVDYYGFGGNLLYRETFPRRNYAKSGLNVLASYSLQ
jgi:uncharacterized protein